MLERTKQYMFRHQPGKIPIGEADMCQRIYCEELLHMTMGVSWANPKSIEEAVSTGTLRHKLKP